MLALLLAVPAAAQQVDCAKAELQMELTYCAEQDWIAADRELNRAYKAARGFARALDQDLPADQRGIETSLRDGQRAWIGFRDNACTAEAGVARGGSMEPMLIYLCWERLTRRRTEDLQEFAKVY